MNEKSSMIGTLLDDRYLIQRVIGEGGMAIVYKALDQRLNRFVAVKIMRRELASDEEFRRRFNAESQAVAMLSHPNIVAVFDVSHSEAAEYIVMELIDGITLKQYMEKRGQMAWKEAVYFARQIANALSHAHERGIIHRDIKPQNMMLLRDGTIKVADFGIAALESEISDNDGQAIGSIHYMAPEQTRGESPDARGDVYSLGVMMYEMLAGEVPYTGDSLGEIAVKHMNAEPVPLREKNPEVPPELEAVVKKAMAARIEERYQSAAELLEDLDSLTKQPPQEQPAPEEQPDVKPVRSVSELSKAGYALRRRRAGKVSFATGLLLILITALFLFRFLWNFWLEDVFSPAERIPLPDFVGMSYASIESNPELIVRYSFDVVFVIDAESEPGIVLSQDPSAGRSMMLTPEGIHVTLTVSTGSDLVEIPDLKNRSYTEALGMLRSLGLVGEIENATSSTVTRDYVISTSPMAGEALSQGSVVFLTVSSGPEILMVEVPNLVGLTEDAAIGKLQNARLSYGGTTRVPSEYEVGTVIAQNAEAFTQLEEHSKVWLTVSAGPQE